MADSFVTVKKQNDMLSITEFLNCESYFLVYFSKRAWKKIVTVIQWSASIHLLFFLFVK